MAIGRHGLQGKQNLYDILGGSLLRHGAWHQGRFRARNIYLLDVLATFCDLTNQIPSTCEA